MGWIKVKIIGLNPWQDFQALLQYRQRIKDEPCKTVFTAQGSIKIEQGEIFIVLFVSLVAYMFHIVRLRGLHTS